MSSFWPIRENSPTCNPVECADERSSDKEVASELVVAGGDAPPIFDAAEEVFDFVS